ncbi:MAG: hypothetical protein P4L83_07645 [Nevskia sp.]|nr:hypothetical protein [Nevskia sp.]
MRRIGWIKSTLLVSAGMLLFCGQAGAVPLFARQTGEACEACHVSFPELTPFGRLFKLNGYTTGQNQWIPFAAMAQAGFTWVNKNHDDQDNLITPKTGRPEFSATSVFLGGKVTDNIGGLAQWTYNNLVVNPDGVSTTGHGSVDNTDLRAVGRHVSTQTMDEDWIYGVSVNNNPTVQDVWNSTPAWGFPFTGPSNVPAPAASAVVSGALAQKVVGFGAYSFWRKSLYTEFSLYRTADGMFTFLRAGQSQPPGSVPALQGYNPYARIAYNREWGGNSLMLGAYGLMVRMYPDNTMQFTPTDRYTDLALDAQFQHITNPHTYTFQASLIRERQSYGASYPATLSGSPIGVGPTPANAADRLLTLKLKGTYYYQRKYGATVALFSTTGDADPGLYGPGSVSGSNNSSPNSHGYILELNYVPIQYVRLMLQYTGYDKFNGMRTNYDGAGRDATNNNTLFLNLWVAY